MDSHPFEVCQLSTQSCGDKLAEVLQVEQSKTVTTGTGQDKSPDRGADTGDLTTPKASGASGADSDAKSGKGAAPSSGHGSGAQDGSGAATS